MIKGLQSVIDCAKAVSHVPELVTAIIREAASEAGVSEDITRPIVEGMVVDSVARQLAFTKERTIRVYEHVVHSTGGLVRGTPILVTADHSEPRYATVAWTAPLTGLIGHGPIDRGVPPPGTDAAAVVAPGSVIVGSLWVIRHLPYDWATDIVADELIRMARALNGGQSDE